MLDAVAAEIERTYPEQIIGVKDTPTTILLRRRGPNRTNSRWDEAMSVFKYISARTRLKPNQMVLVGHGGNHPVVSNATLAGKARNRRVEFVVYPDKFGQVTLRGGGGVPVS